MQATTVTHPAFLILHLAEHAIIVAVADRQSILCERIIAHHDANNLLIPTIAIVLREVALELNSLQAISASRGLGQFITLRAVVVTANGLSYATGIPLIGISLLEMGVRAVHRQAYKATCWIQKAHRGEVSLCWYQPDRQSYEITMPTATCITWLKEHVERAEGPVLWAGNAVPELMPQLAPWYAQQELITELSLAMAHRATIDAWDRNDTVASLVPIYNRSATFGRNIRPLLKPCTKAHGCKSPQ